MGENHRIPKPQAKRTSMSFWPRSSLRLKALPMSVKSTPRIPTFWKMGNSNSALPRNCWVPPMLKSTVELSGRPASSTSILGPSELRRKPRTLSGPPTK